MVLRGGEEQAQSVASFAEEITRVRHRLLRLKMGQGDQNGREEKREGERSPRPRGRNRRRRREQLGVRLVDLPVEITI